MFMGRVITLFMLRWRRRIVRSLDTLSKADKTGKKVIEAGWGQRFSLAGSAAFRNLTLGRVARVPTEYMFVYAPRDEEEIQIVMGIVKAGLQYGTGLSDVG